MAQRLTGTLALDLRIRICGYETITAYKAHTAQAIDDDSGHPSLETARYHSRQARQNLPMGRICLAGFKLLGKNCRFFKWHGI